MAEITKTYHNIVPITGVLHIGAARCEELEAYRKCGLTNDKIIWIEANPEQIEKVKKTAVVGNDFKRKKPNYDWVCPENFPSIN